MLIAPIGGGKVAAIMVGESDKITSHFFNSSIQIPALSSFLMLL
jgi:hypothetical protein